MKRLFKRILSTFSSQKNLSRRTDFLYEFDTSIVTLCTKINSLSNFTEKDFENIEHCNIRRVIYDVTEDAEILEFLTEKHDKHLEKFFSSDYLFKGIIYDLQVVMDEKELIKKVDFKALLQASQHLTKLRPKGWNNIFQVFMGLKNEKGINITNENQKIVLENLKENFEAMDNILANSFSFKINHILKWYKGVPLELQFALANLHPGFLKSIDLDVFAYADQKKSEIEQNKEILSALYQNGSETYNCLFLKNMKLQDDQWVNSKNLDEGVISFQHLSDMLKLLSFKGSLVINYDKDYQRNVQMISTWLQNNRFNLREKPNISDKHEIKITDGSTDTIIDVV